MQTASGGPNFGSESCGHATDRLDARWLAMMLARDLLSECAAWLAPTEIQRLHDQTRLRKTLAGERTGWAERLHALLAHEGWPYGRLLTAAGRRWVDALELDPPVRAQVDVMLGLTFESRPGSTCESPRPPTIGDSLRRAPNAPGRTRVCPCGE